MNTKKSLNDFILDIDSQIVKLKELKSEAKEKLYQADIEERSEAFRVATLDPINWAEILRTNENGEMIPVQEEFLKQHIKSVNRILDFNGHFHDTLQLSFDIKMINYSYNKDHIDKLVPVINPLISGLAPVKVHSKIQEKFKVIPVLDKRQGEKGSFSILLGDDGLASIYREFRVQPEFIKTGLQFRDALIYIAKKHYFHG